MTNYSKMQLIKRHMFAMRNGVISDTLRRAGSPFSVIFGMNLPQLVEMAATFGPDEENGWKLWNDRRTRESMLLAPMLIPSSVVTKDQAMNMVNDIPCEEIADVLCLKLLRKLPCAFLIAQQCLEDDVASDITRYCGLRLLWNLVNDDPVRAASLAVKETTSENKTHARLATSLIEEADFLSGNN